MRHEATPPFTLPAQVRGAVAQQQLRTGVSLRIAKDPQIEDLAGLDYTGNADKAVVVNPGGTGLVLTDTVSVTTGATVTRTAGETLGGHRAVRIAADNLAYYGNPDATARFTVGITTGAAALGTDATIQVEGEIEEPSWAWSATEIVWLAANGTLTQTVPTSGHLFQVGIPMGPTRLRIEPQLIVKIS